MHASQELLYLMIPVNLSSGKGLLPMHLMSVDTRRGVILVTCQKQITSEGLQDLAGKPLQQVKRLTENITLAVTTSLLRGTSGKEPGLMMEITESCK